MTSSIRELADWLKSRDKIALATHVNPDGDALGSTLAMLMALSALGKSCAAVCADVPPEMYAFLPCVDRFVKPDSLPFEPEHLLCIDCADPRRIGSAQSLYDRVRDFASIDHHVTNSGFGALAVVDVSAAATGELMLELVDALGAPLTPDMAICLYSAIATDCGNFGFSNTTPNTLRAAARCLETGINVSELAYRLFRARSAARTRLLGAALHGIEYLRGGEIALLRITGEMMAQSGAGEDDVDRIINFGVDTEGVEVSVLAEQRGEITRFSLRSKKRVNVAAIAAAMGGGGHDRASGATVSLPFEPAIEKMLAAVNAAMDP